MHVRVEVDVQDPDSLYIEYSENGTGRRFRTRTSPISRNHKLDLLLLKANTTYTYRIYLGRQFREKSKLLEFKTREQSPWLLNHWFNDTRPHDSSALGDDGFILVCFGRLPGYMAMLDSKGEIRWYWQVEDVGAKIASLTPRGTILTMLRPFQRDVSDDIPMSAEDVHKEEHKKPIKRGSIGFAAGTQLAEVSLDGRTLWRIDLKKVEKEKEYQVIHHDIYMAKNGTLYTLFRPRKVATFKDEDNKMVTDTLGGDGILQMDSLGHVLHTWSAWSVWDVQKDAYISRYRNDRFHANGFSFDKDGNYLFSVPIEDQVWKINAQTGQVMWKLGRNGDIKMDPKGYFSFQHSPYIDIDGHLTLFDNGLYNEISGGKSFAIDESNKSASLVFNAQLPENEYTSRMGSCYVLPNGNLLQCSSKRGAIMITDKKGNVLWESIMPFVPYRAVYVPQTFFKDYFTEIK